MEGSYGHTKCHQDPKSNQHESLPVGPKLDLKPLPVTWSLGEILAEVRFLGMGDTSSGAQAFWRCAQELLLIGSGDPLGCLGSNPDWAHASQ